MVPSEENQLVPKEVESAAEEPRVLCIIQDTTNSKTVNERVTLNLPASTPLKRLFEDVASKVGYVNGSFDLVWGNGDNVTDTTPIDQNSDKTILDAGFEPGKKNFLHLTDKDGEQPHMMLDESGTTDDSAQDRFIGPLPREGSLGCTNDYVSQSYSYSSVLSKSETAPGCCFSACTMIPQEVRPRLSGSSPASRDTLWKGSAALTRRQVPGQVLGGWLGSSAAQGTGEDSKLQLSNETNS